VTSSPEIVHEYVAETAPRGFFVHALPVHRYPIAAWRARELVWNFFRRDLFGRFRGSAGGLLWVLIQPLFQFVVYFLIFGIFFANPKDLTSKGPDPVFAISLFAGIVLFNFISEATTRGLTSVLENANLVKKVAFPCELLPLTPALVSAVVYFVASLVGIAVGCATGVVHLGWPMLLWPLLIVFMVMFTTGIGLFLAACNVFARDVQYIWGILSLTWFFMSPVFWKLQQIRDIAHALEMPGLVQLILLNPAYSMLSAQRQLFGLAEGISPEEYSANFLYDLPTHLWMAGFWSVLSLFVGYGWFMDRRRKFADLV
jgi:ABC-type polysaccharide/polyol phosphate export permease